MKQTTREYVTLPLEQLRTRLRSTQEEFTDTGFQLATRKMSNSARLKILRKEIARLRFFIAEREREGETDAI